MVTSACDVHSILLISEMVPANPPAGTTHMECQDLIVLCLNPISTADSMRADGLAQPATETLRCSQQSDKPRFTGFETLPTEFGAGLQSRSQTEGLILRLARNNYAPTRRKRPTPCISRWSGAFFCVTVVHSYRLWSEALRQYPKLVVISGHPIHYMRFGTTSRLLTGDKNVCGASTTLCRSAAEPSRAPRQ